jgi:hypothetical protein
MIRILVWTVGRWDHDMGATVLQCAVGWRQSNAKGGDSGLSSSNQVFALDSVEIVLQIKLHSPREEVFTYPPYQRGADPVCLGAMKGWERFWDQTVSHLAIGNHRYCTGSFMPGLSKRNSGHVAIHVLQRME